MSGLLPKEFIREERQRVFEPGSTFAECVVAGLGPVSPSSGPVWDDVPSFARPMVALATVVLVALVSVHFFYPTPPGIGIIDAYLSTEAMPAEEWLYRDAEPPEGQDLLIEISIAESEWAPR